MSPREQGLLSGSYRGKQDQEEAEQEIKLQYGGIGAFFGLLLGIVVGSKITFHTPIRRRVR